VSAMTEAQRLQVKLFFRDGARPEPRAVIELFHRVIRERLLDGLLIDVTDYSHVHQGPGVMLIGHEANYSTDEAGGRPGLLYSHKRDAPGAVTAPFEERLAGAARSALAAARRIEEELGVPIHGGELLVRWNDRLLAPDDDETVAAARPPLEALAARLWAGAPVTLLRVATDGRCAMMLQCSTEADAATLHARL
jgi:hypothetical protein